MKQELLTIMFMPQGSNFIALTTSAWLLLFVAELFSFFLLPQLKEEWTFLKIPFLATSSFGFLIFGFLALLAGSVVIIALRLPKVYGYYKISRTAKGAIMFAWALLWIPVLIPAYLATIFPYTGDLSFWVEYGTDSAFAILILCQFILLSPIYFKAMGVRI
jgi:hypothetical protein